MPTDDEDDEEETKPSGTSITGVIGNANENAFSFVGPDSLIFHFTNEVLARMVFLFLTRKELCKLALASKDGMQMVENHAEWVIAEFRKKHGVRICR